MLDIFSLTGNLGLLLREQLKFGLALIERARPFVQLGATALKLFNLASRLVLLLRKCLELGLAIGELLAAGLQASFVLAPFRFECGLGRLQCFGSLTVR